MKVNVSDSTARKILAVVPDTVGDPELLALRQRLTEGLEVSSTGYQLDRHELNAVIEAVNVRKDQIRHTAGADALWGLLNRGVTKLNALAIRMGTRAGSERG